MSVFFTPHFRKNPRATRGFTLTELAIALGVVGAILGAVWVAASQVSANNKTQKAAGEILQIIGGYRSLYSQHGIDVAGCFPATVNDVTCTGANAGFFPTDMFASGATCTTSTTSTYPKTPWSGTSYAQVETCQTNNTIGITYANLPQSACNSLAALIYGSPDVTYQAINGTSQWLPPYAANTSWTITQIASHCAAGSANSVQIGLKL